MILFFIAISVSCEIEDAYGPPWEKKSGKIFFMFCLKISIDTLYRKKDLDSNSHSN